MLVKKSGLDLHNPLTQEKDKYTILIRASDKRIGAIKGEWVLSISDHIREIKGERRNGKKYRDNSNDAKLQGIFSDKGAFQKRLFLCAKRTGAWISIVGTKFTGSALAAIEFRGFYVLVTMLTPIKSKTNVTV